MSLGQLQDQNQVQPSSNLLRLGSTSGPPKFDHLISPSNPSSLLNMPSSMFFMSDAANQGFHHRQDHGHGSYMNKPLHGLLQLPDLQGSTDNNSHTSANLFNLGFFSNTSGANSISTSEIQCMGDQVGSGFSSLYSSTSMQHENISPHMSATALLQKAAQIGSTTSNNNASSLLRGLGSSLSSGTKSDRPVLSPNFGSNFDGSGSETLRSSQMEDDSNLQGLMNSLANGNSSIFDGGASHGQSNDFGGFSGSELHQNLAAGMGGGSEKLTLDFLGVGGMMGNLGGGFSQREQHGINVSSLDPGMKSSAQANPQQFGRAKLV
ncbi:Indeterminate(ID)-domain 5, putative isoform 2 [Hibiscus syriacus]|uniref:Indeterminate(ID)-domain 5, putative isoform 2 n=2 Tax=Hibiscus syriacus TaxID=106335 RepID=A0A6A3BI02_HIBSY|nr:Indeterminate(ID)-domain 5, putative isoform 2 [Hibiscus syriacus]